MSPAGRIGGVAATAVALAVGTPGCATTYYGTAESWDASVQQATDAAPLAGVEVEARQGDVQVRAVPGDSVRAVARMGRAKTWGPLPGSCPEAEEGAFRIEAHRTRYGRLELSIDPKPGDECVVRWELEVPRRMSVTARLRVGDVEVDGVSGGLDLRTGVGDVRVRVPGGNVVAHAGVGSVRVWSTAPSHGTARLHTDVGDVDLTLEGHAVERGKPPGAGDQLAFGGSGTDRLDLSADVGDVFLALREPTGR